MMEKKGNNGESTRKYITTALFKLMGNNDFDKITITMITKKAGVGRVSYYRNFSSKEDIIIKYFQTNVISLMESAPHVEKQKDYLPLLEFVFQKFFESREVFRLINKAKLGYIYLDFLNSEMNLDFQKSLPSTSKLYAVLYSGALYNLCMSWIGNNFSETPKELASFFYDFCFAER